MSWEKMIRVNSLTLLAFLSLFCASSPGFATEEKDKLPEVKVFKNDTGFTSKDLTNVEKRILELDQPRSSFKTLNDSWGWPASKKKVTFEERLHLPENAELYFALTPYTDILFRFLANKYNGHPTYLAYDFPGKINLVSKGLSLSEILKDAGKETRVTAYLNEFLDLDQNRALMERLANLKIKSSSSLYFTVAITSARAFLFLAQGEFEKAHHAIQLLDEMWKLFEEQNEPRKRIKTP